MRFFSGGTYPLRPFSTRVLAEGGACSGQRHCDLLNRVGPCGSSDAQPRRRNAGRDGTLLRGHACFKACPAPVPLILTFRRAIARLLVIARARALLRFLLGNKNLRRLLS